MAHIWSSAILLAAAALIAAEPGLRGYTLRMLRETSNQTSAESLNLPANSSTIRANISDTFSCQNRTYGYYADVDNDCQVFHVCQPSRTSSGRNITYKWSFICPNETVFNQEVLVCTRPRESIPCDESPMYYYVNDEFGKVNNQSVNTTQSQSNNQTNTQSSNTTKLVMSRSRIKHIQKENLVDKVQNNVENTVSDQRNEAEDVTNVKTNNREYIPIDIRDVKPVIDEVSETETYQDRRKVDNSVEINERMGAERSIKQNDMRNRRFGFRFKADVV